MSWTKTGNVFNLLTELSEPIVQEDGYNLVTNLQTTWTGFTQIVAPSWTEFTKTTTPIWIPQQWVWENINIDWDDLDINWDDMG